MDKAYILRISTPNPAASSPLQKDGRLSRFAKQPPKAA